MLVVPVSLCQAFEAQLDYRNIPDQQRRNFHKWFRFYLDFEPYHVIGGNKPICSH